MHEIDLVVLDLAGTTVEDKGQVATALTAALAEHGITVTPEQVSAVRGASKRQAIAGLVAAHEGPLALDRVEAAYAAFLRHLGRLYDGSGQAVPGAERVVAWMRERGVRVALNTGFDRETTDLLVRTLGWRDAVDAVVCVDDVPQGRPAPYLIFRAMEVTATTSVHRVANVGDTALDLQAGHNAGVRFNVGVLSGAHTRARLSAEPHTHLLSSVAELPSLWSLG